MKPRPISIPESQQLMAAVSAAFFCAFSSSVFSCRISLHLFFRASFFARIASLP